MKIEIDKACFEEIIKPGDFYILNAQGNGVSDPGPIEDLYWIRCAEEIVAAVEMEIEIYLGEDYELREFNGVRKVNESCYKLDLVCYCRHKKMNVPRPLYLYRIVSFGEMLVKAKELFGAE